MSAGSLARRFARTGAVYRGRVSGAVLVAVLCLLLPAAANAYTLVLRSGRQVTVPDDFKVTPAAVIYEASPGFSVTVWLTNVDIAATERANAEPEGSFARRIRQGPGGEVAAPTPAAVKTERRPAPRVITDKDLEPSRLRREAQEAEYERTHRERGMPSKQELQRRSEEQDRRLHELALQAQAEQSEAELEATRSELVEASRNLNELSLRLSEQTGAYAPVYAPTNNYPYYPYYYAPPVQLITRFPFGRRVGFGRGSFLPQPRPRAWPYNPRQGRFFPSPGGQHLNVGAPPPAMAPAAPARRR